MPTPRHLTFVLVVGLAGCAARAGAPASTPDTALPARPERGDEAACGALGGDDTAARDAALLRLLPRVPPVDGDPELQLAVVRGWCLSSFRATYFLPGGCERHDKACDVDVCVAWSRAHGATEDGALDTCLQDCNCGE